MAAADVASAQELIHYMQWIWEIFKMAINGLVLGGTSNKEKKINMNELIVTSTLRA